MAVHGHLAPLSLQLHPIPRNARSLNFNGVGLVVGGVPRNGDEREGLAPTAERGNFYSMLISSLQSLQQPTLSPETADAKR